MTIDDLKKYLDQEGTIVHADQDMYFSYDFDPQSMCGVEINLYRGDAELHINLPNDRHSYAILGSIKHGGFDDIKRAIDAYCQGTLYSIEIILPRKLLWPKKIVRLVVKNADGYYRDVSTGKHYEYSSVATLTHMSPS